MARGAQELRCSSRPVWPVDRPCARPKATPWHRADMAPPPETTCEPDPRRAGDERLERPLRLHLLSPAVRVQPVWRWISRIPPRNRRRGDPDPDRGLNHPPDDEQKRDRIDSNAQCSKPIHAGRGINTTHVQLPLDSRRERAERPAALRPRNGDSASWQLQRSAPRCRSLVSRRNPVWDLLLRAKHLSAAARNVWHRRQSSRGERDGRLQRTMLACGPSQPRH
jgi:hypothetical protein